jgi:hypothetical protein
MVSRIAHPTFDCHNAFALSSWWKQVLGYTDLPGNPNLVGDPECLIVDPVSGSQLLFIEVDESKSVKNRLHLDLAPTDRRRDEEIERVLALGATALEDLRQPDGTGWLVMADPEGNEFCIVRSDAERVTTPS